MTKILDGYKDRDIIDENKVVSEEQESSSFLNRTTFKGCLSVLEFLTSSPKENWCTVVTSAKIKDLLFSICTPSCSSSLFEIQKEIFMIMIKEESLLKEILYHFRDDSLLKHFLEADNGFCLLRHLFDSCEVFDLLNLAKSIFQKDFVIQHISTRGYITIDREISTEIYGTTLSLLGHLSTSYIVLTNSYFLHYVNHYLLDQMAHFEASCIQEMTLIIYPISRILFNYESFYFDQTNSLSKNSYDQICIFFLNFMNFLSSSPQNQKDVNYGILLMEDEEIRSQLLEFCNKMSAIFLKLPLSVYQEHVDFIGTVLSFLHFQISIKSLPIDHYEELFKLLSLFLPDIFQNKLPFLNDFCLLFQQILGSENLSQIIVDNRGDNYFEFVQNPLRTLQQKALMKAFKKGLINENPEEEDSPKDGDLENRLCSEYQLKDIIFRNSMIIWKVFIKETLTPEGNLVERTLLEGELEDTVSNFHSLMCIHFLAHIETLDPPIQKGFCKLFFENMAFLIRLNVLTVNVHPNYELESGCVAVSNLINVLEQFTSMFILQPTQDLFETMVNFFQLIISDDACKFHIAYQLSRLRTTFLDLGFSFKFVQLNDLIGEIIAFLKEGGMDMPLRWFASHCLHKALTSIVKLFSERTGHDLGDEIRGKMDEKAEEVEQMIDDLTDLLIEFEGMAS